MKRLPKSSAKSPARRSQWSSRSGTSSWLMAALFVLAAAPYLGVWTHSFINFDDDMYITRNRMVMSGLSWASFRWAWTTFDACNWHPLTWLSHMLDCQLFGLSAGWHHLVNVLLHAANTALLMATLHRLTASVWRSALVAALFAVHPLHVESVAWIAERKDALSTLFGLLAIWSYAGYVQKGGAARYGLVLVFFALSLLGKPMLVTLPALLLLLDWWPLKRSSVVFLLLEKLPLFLMAAASCVITVMAQRASHTLYSFEKIPLAARVANAAVSYGLYLVKVVAPVNLAVYYPLPAHWEAWPIAAALVTLTLITALCVWQFRRRPWLLVGWWWYLGTMVPVIGLVQVGSQAMADRYTYVPTIGLFIMIAWSIPSKSPARQRGWALGATALLIALSILCAVQVSYWRDSRTLFARALQVTDRNVVAEQNLGNALLDAGDVDGGITHLRNAVAIWPDYSLARVNLANAYLRQQRFAEAMDQLAAAIQLSPRSAMAHNSRGAALLAMNRLEDAELEFAVALECEPENVEARGNHGLALMRLERWDQAIAEFETVIRQDPDNANWRGSLATALFRSGSVDQAIDQWMQALRIDSRRAATHANVGVALQSVGRLDEAIAHLQESLRLQPDFPAARAALDAALQQRQPTPIPVSPLNH